MTDPHGIQSAAAPLADRLVAALKGREKGVLLAGVGLQLAVLLAMAVLRLSVLWRGDVYYVRVQPVDPRDLFRGDYVVLSYEFSRLPAESPGLPREAWVNPGALAGRDVYVELVPEGDGRHWRAGSYGLSPPGRGPYLRGQLTGPGRVEYGIESFFVQEGQGRRYEGAVRSGRLSAEIAVAPDGQAALRGLHVSP